MSQVTATIMTFLLDFYQRCHSCFRPAAIMSFERQRYLHSSSLALQSAARGPDAGAAACPASKAPIRSASMSSAAAPPSSHPPHVTTCAAPPCATLRYVFNDSSTKKPELGSGIVRCYRSIFSAGSFPASFRSGSRPLRRTGRPSARGRYLQASGRDRCRSPYR